MCISEGPPGQKARQPAADARETALRAIREALSRHDGAPERTLAEIGAILAEAGYGLGPPGLDEELFARLWWGADAR